MRLFQICPECGHMIFDADEFCDYCGWEIDWNKVKDTWGVKKSVREC
jgi:uncharacterized OB-fold protein